MFGSTQITFASFSRKKKYTDFVVVNKRRKTLVYVSVGPVVPLFAQY